jgi:hypothetical protein
MITIPFGKPFGDLQYHSMEGECIRSLLQFADTFTTIDYEERRDEWIAEVVGCTREEIGEPRQDWAGLRRQILGSCMVVEVAPDVWAKYT